MARMYHAAITVEGHTFLADIPFFESAEELSQWYKDTVGHFRSIIKEG